VVVDETETDVRTALLRQRRVMLTGVLDDTTVTHAAAKLMMLDGESSREVELIVNSEGGPMPAVVTLLDVFGLMRAPVRTCCIGRALGTAAVVLASGTARRTAAGNAMIGLRLQERYDVNGRAVDVERYAADLGRTRERIVAHLRDATGLDEDTLVHELSEGESLTADAARARGLIDEVISR
jgi:ATP-dependent Clp protease protease subunit